jgi:hypothetical protein
VTRRTLPPPKPAPRHINLGKLTKAQIEKLRADAYALLDFPELLDQPKWRLAALHIARALVVQNPWPPLGPRGVAALVDESIDYQCKQGIPFAEAVRSARATYAKLLSMKHETSRSGTRATAGSAYRNRDKKIETVPPGMCK